MPTREIPREEWVKFFDMFSKEHEGRVAIVELVGRKLGDQPESTRLSLWQLQSGSAACSGSELFRRNQTRPIGPAERGD